MDIINGDLVALYNLTAVQYEELVEYIPVSINTTEGTTYIPLETMNLVPDSVLSLEKRIRQYSQAVKVGQDLLECDEVRDKIKLCFDCLPQYVQDMLLNSVNAEVMDIIG